MNAITTTTLQLTFSDLERLAEAIAKSGLFGIKTRDQAVALMMIASAEGRHPALAARDYDIVNGRPTKKAEAMMRDFIQAGGKVEWHALTDEMADATFTHPQTGSVRIDWDMKRAITAFGKKDMYAKFPRQMLRSRVVSEGIRTLWPLATSGMYVEEEIGNLPPHNGPTLEAEAEAPPPHSLRAVAASMQKAARVAEKTPPAARTDEQWRVWVDKLQAACAVLYRRGEVVEIAERPSVSDAIATGPAWVQREVSAILAENYKRFPEEPDAETPDDLHIEGEQFIAAG